MHHPERNKVTSNHSTALTRFHKSIHNMSFDLVFFGGTGDLTWRKLMPALFQAFRHGKLPSGGRILAVARDQHYD